MAGQTTLAPKNRFANVSVFVPHVGCPHRCSFCDQRSISGVAAAPDDRRLGEILGRAEESFSERMQRRGEKLTAQIAFFGGSFTAIPREEMVRLLQGAQPFLAGGVFDGIRVSTRPDAVDQEVLALLRAYGVRAVELGAQSMDDRVLAAAGRGHTAADVARAAEMITRNGFSLGLQMMTGLPLDSDGGAVETARALADLKPETVRIYPALTLRGTELAALWDEGRYRPQTLEDAVELCAQLLRFFTDREIPVIKLGLHEGADLRDQLLAGPYHPAFRELCEGRVLLGEARRQLAGRPPGPVRFAVARGSASKMAGHGRRNLLALREQGYRARITESDEIPYLSVRVD